MKTETYEKQDGTKGERYIPEEGDEYTAKYEKVGENQRAANVKGKPKIITNYFLGVKTKDGKEISIKMTAGQKKALDKEGDLREKTITFEEYTHDKWGKQLGARVKK